MTGSSDQPAPQTFEGERLTAALATKTQQDRWDQRGAAVGMTFSVAPCPYTDDELDELAAAGKTVAFLPAEVATQSTRHLLGAMFPKMGCYSLQPDNQMVNDINAWGWFDYEASVDAPYTGNDEAELFEKVRADGRTLLSINQYIVASQDTRARVGRYLDERRSWARIGSRVTGRIIAVRFDGDEMADGLGNEPPVSGSLLSAYDLGAADKNPFVGGRTFGRARSEQDQPIIPLPDPVVRPGIHPSQTREIDLGRERQRLIDLFVSVGFHSELGMSAEEYAASFPQLTPQPPEYRGRLDIPLLVETRIPWERQYELTGVYSSPFLAMFAAPEPASPASAHRAEPYAAWFNAWGQRFPDPTSPPDARASLAADEVGANLMESTAMLLAYPELNETGRYYDFVGYIFPPPDAEKQRWFAPIERTAGACRWRGRPEFACNLHPTEYDLFRPLIRGTAITTA